MIDSPAFKLFKGVKVAEERTCDGGSDPLAPKYLVQVSPVLH